MWKYFLFLIFLNLFIVDVGASGKNDYSAELVKAELALTHKDYVTAYDEFHRVAEQSKNPLAEFNLALFSHFGWGRDIDEAAACKWFGKAASGNIPAAQHFYADCLRKGLVGRKSPLKASTWYRRAADNGHLISLCSLAELYITGAGVSKDTSQGLALCQQAADAGLTKAMLRMAKFHLSKDSKLRDVGSAINYLRNAAQLRNVEAQFMLGMIHRDGVDGNYKDYTKARQWLELASAYGHVPAYYQTGFLFFNAPLDSTTKALPADALAKAYLWLSAAEKRSQQKDERQESRRMLSKVSAVMPETWLGDLNQKLNEHLDRYDPVENTESEN